MMKSFEIIALSPANQYQRKLMQLTENKYNTDSCLSYGLWSKYNPLSTIAQIGKYGLFDSHCFHLHNAIDQYSYSLNLIYYDCFDSVSRKIIKTILFINNLDQQNRFTFEIDPFDYENTWYYIQLIAWPSQDIFKLIFIKRQDVQLQTNNQMKYPFKDENLILSFGGGFIVRNSKIIDLKQGEIFSYFPGTIILQDFSTQTLTIDFDFIHIANQAYQQFEQCVCQSNEIFLIGDKDLKDQDQDIYISDNINCDSFIILGWIKIKEIINSSGLLSYQSLKVSANLQNPIFQNQNLSPFQLLYHMTTLQNEIEVTTYSYNFPDISIDFSDDPFLIKKMLLITNNILLWHYLKVELQDNKINVEITFYEGFEIFSYYAKFEVHQFHNCQLKIQFGNCLQTQSNYLNTQMKDLQFFNCYKKLTTQICHYSCYECDGPTNQNCLSCSIESQRIYIPQHKVCICPFNTIDNQNKCQTYKDSNLRVIQDENLNFDKKCKYGFFELDGDCIQCPSMIKKDFLSCVECLNNPKSWFQYPICQKSLVIKPNTNYYEASVEFGDVQYYYDGIQLNPIHYTYSFSYETDIKNITNIFKEFYLAQNYFRQFCQQMDFAETDQYICYECFLFNCQFCQVTPTTFICVKCYGDYKLIDGECIFSAEIKARSKPICLPPYYYSFENYCKICEIKNCIYCFEYSTDNLQFCSLVDVQNMNLKFQQKIRTGCALCEENFIFDFTLEICLNQIPQIKNCQRSYISLLSKEECVSSMIGDFSIAPEISNCQDYIDNCRTCSINVDQQIKCVVCQDKFMIQNDQCYQNEEFDPQKISIYNQTNKIQSFVLQFVPKLRQYVYNKFLNQSKPITCDPDCILCDQITTYCKQCPLNYYKKYIITMPNKMCLQCHPLCQVCLQRSNKDIELDFPSLIVDNQNQIYTKKCIKPYYDPSFSYDPYLQSVRYCLTKDCKDHFFLDIPYQSCDFSRFNRFYESKINTDYCNQIGIEILSIELVLNISDQQCFLILPFTIQTELKKKVFSLKRVNFKFSSQKYLEITSFTSNPFNNFDQVEFSNLGFVIDSDQHFIFYNNNNQFDLILKNFTINQSILQNIDSLFQTEVFGNITLNNITIIDTIFINSSLFNLKSFQMLGSIIITNLQIKNCTFIESAFFKLSQIESLLSYKYLYMEQCKLTKSSIFSFESNHPNQRTLIGLNTMIINNKFYNSYLINSTFLIEVSLFNFQLSLNLMDNSIMIQINYNIAMSLISIYQNIFVFSQFLSINQIQLRNHIQCNITSFEAIQNQFQGSNLILIFSTLSTNYLLIQFYQFKILNNSRCSSHNESNQLFCINSQEIHISNFIISDNDDLMIFQLSENKNILISNIIFQNTIQNFKIPLSQACLTTNKKNNFLYVSGFTTIQIKNLHISKIVSVDEPLIQINPSYQNLSYGMSQVEMVNITFTQNILIQSTLVNQISMLIIQSEYRESILLENILYEENFLHSYSSSAVMTTVSLLYIQSQLSQLKVENFHSKNNALTNSSNSLITIMSAHVMLSKFSINNHNFISQDLWVNYYELQFKDNLNQDNLNEIVFQILQIKNIGGAGSFLVQSLSCIDCSFSKILAAQSLIFEITTTEAGYIDLQNITIDQVENNLQSTEKGSGCFSIYSSNSKLNLRLVNAFLSNIFNRMASLILTITPSKSQNIILLQDTNILNCVSLINQIINVQFSSLIAIKNIVTIKNIRIIQNQQVWIDYFTKVRDLFTQEVTETINNQNSLISFQNCIILIEDFVIEGIIINSIFYFVNLPKLKLNNVKLDKISVLYSFNLISVMQLQQIKSMIVIENLSIKNIQLYQNNLTSYLTYSQIMYKIRGCKIVQQFNQTFQQGYFQSYVNSIQQNDNKEGGSFIYIKSISNSNGIYFQDITFEHNNCQQCQNGLVFFELSNIQFIKLDNFNCNYNKINKFGCLHFSSNTYYKQKVLIKNSNFLFNNGTQGIGIFTQKVSLSIKQCKLIKNKAQDFGGGLYMEIDSADLIVNRSIIIANIARIGGGIYFEGNCNLNKNNFVQSQVLFNSAQEYGNNVRENPTHLAFYINQMENPSYSVTNNNQSINILNLKTYRMIEQGRQIVMKDLLIPSNQVIKPFQIFDIRQSKYLPFIKDISLTYKNSRNEIMHNFINSTCIVKGKRITSDKNKIIDKEVQKILIFDIQTNSFDFGSLSFSLDPYKLDYHYLQIDISCSLKGQQDTLKYRIYAKSLKCQLGEFYVDNGCQICQSNQGYYSVTYNATKCSIFDKGKYSNITSNMIELLPGVWRPNNYSDYVEPCFKNEFFCIGGWQVGDHICSVGHIGALCEECDIYGIRGQGNFYKNQWDQNCRECQFDWTSIFPTMIICLWYNGCYQLQDVYIDLDVFKKYLQIQSTIFITHNCIKIQQNIVQTKLRQINQQMLDQESIQLKMLINYLWIYSVIFTFNIRFSFSLLFIEQTSDTSYFIAKDLDCYISSIQSIPIVQLKIFTMLILMIILFNLIIAGQYLHTLITKQRYDISILSNSALYLYVFNYAGLIKIFSSVLSKREVSNQNYIQGDVSLKYGSQVHLKWVYYFIIPGIFIIGILIPILIFILLRLNRQKLDKIKLRKHICYLLNEYKQERYYWELIKLFKKSVIIFIMTNFETEIVLKASLLGLCLLIYEILAIFHQPFNLQKYNSLDLQTAQICSISIFLALTKTICEQKNYISPSIMIQIFIIGCFIKLCYPFIFGIARSYVKKYQFFYLNKLHFFLISKVPNLYFAQILGRSLEREKLKQQKLKSNFTKLKNHLIFLSRVQLRNSKQILTNITCGYLISPQSSRILSTKSSRIGVEKLFFNNVEEYENNKK